MDSPQVCIRVSYEKLDDVGLRKARCSMPNLTRTKFGVQNFEEYTPQ
jgi:hypothetical protein